MLILGVRAAGEQHHALCADRLSRHTPDWSDKGAETEMIVMDRENLWAPGWSHVLSTSNDVSELRAFCAQVGAPASALHLGNRRWPHLDLKLLPRERALRSPDVRVFERTSDMLRFLKKSALRAS
jgi:hypothetical protein